MRFTQRFQHFPDPRIGNIVFHIVGSVPGNRFPFLTGQSQLELLRDNGIKLDKLLIFRFNRGQQVILVQEAYTGFPGVPNLLDERRRIRMAPFPGQFQEHIRKQPVS